MTFYPEGVTVPQELRTDRVWLRPLRATDVDLDYDAVMASAEMLHVWCQCDWPADGFTLAENLADLVRHEREHLERLAFTYTVVNPEGTRCLGCVYITPLGPKLSPLGEGATYPADVTFWVRASEVEGGLDAHLLSALRAWFRTDWAFDRLLFAVSAAYDHHAALIEEAGLEELLLTAGDVRPADAAPSEGRWRVFG